MSRSHSALYVDGTWLPAAGSTVWVTRSASTGAVVGDYVQATSPDLEAAVTAARRAFDEPQGWAEWDPAARAVAIRRLADAVEARGEEFGVLIAEEVGTPREFAIAANVGRATSRLRLFADMAERLAVEEVRTNPSGSTTVRRLPVGVVGMVLPWNYPLNILGLKLGAAMAAGCTMVIKPALETGLDSFLFAEAVAEAEIPAGVINVLPGGADIGEALVVHPEVDKISFTGSTPVGRRIGALCGERLKSATLELGGKGAAIVLDDADLDAFGQALKLITFANAGQTCTANTRILASRTNVKAVTAVVEEVVSKYIVGHALDPQTEIGPLVSERQRQTVERHMAKATAEGAVAITGGGRPDNLPDGWFVEPTVYANVGPKNSIFQEEVFGPVASISVFGESDDDAVAMANATEYGLSGSVWSVDEGRADAVARRVKAGTQGLNRFFLDNGSPFGGWKQSGLGVELGPEGLDEYVKYQSIVRS